MGQGRRQTERITIKQARSERQAANDQKRRSTGPGSARKDKLGNTLGNVARGKQDFALGECLCAAFM